MTNPSPGGVMKATVGDVMRTLSRMGCPPWRLMHTAGEAIGLVKRDEKGSSYLLREGVRYYLDGRDVPESTGSNPH